MNIYFQDWELRASPIIAPWTAIKESQSRQLLDAKDHAVKQLQAALMKPMTRLIAGKMIIIDNLQPNGLTKNQLFCIKLCVLHLWYNGITSALQAEDAGSTPVGC